MGAMDFQAFRRFEAGRGGGVLFFDIPRLVRKYALLRFLQVCR